MIIWLQNVGSFCGAYNKICMSTSSNPWNAFGQANRHLVKHLPFGEQSKALSRMYQEQKAQSPNLQAAPVQRLYARAPPQARPMPAKYEFEAKANPLGGRDGSACPPLKQPDCRKHKACEWIAGTAQRREHCRRRAYGAPQYKGMASTSPLPKWVLKLYGQEAKVAPPKVVARKAAAPKMNIADTFAEMIKGDLRDNMPQYFKQLWPQVLNSEYFLPLFAGYLQRLKEEAIESDLPDAVVLPSLWEEVRKEFWVNVGVVDMEDTEFQGHKYGL
jgi:hypothetical protein